MMFSRFWSTLAVATAVVILPACGESTSKAATDATSLADGGNDVSKTCVPDRTQYDNIMAGLVTSYCGSCHGSKPDFGASSTLTGGYNSLIKGEIGQRAVDRMALRLADRTMPPQGTPPIPHQAIDSLTEWASCGAIHPDHGKGIVVDKPVFTAPATPPADSETFDLRADDFAIAKNTLDRYQCFTFEVPVAQDRFLQRIETVLDRSEVVHHIVLLKDPEKQFALGRQECKNMPKNSLYLYAWAPGGGAVQFPTGGLRMQKGEHYVLQIHYNNGAGLTNIADKSGVRIWHGAPGGTEYGMIAAGPLAFSIPAKSTTTATGNCIAEQTTQLLAGMPHMHNLGQQFRTTIVRKDGTREPLISLTGWSFEMQPFYKLDATLQPGDRLETSCTWQNDGADAVPMGENTADEMCFLFTFATPTPKKPYCNDFVIDPTSDVDYQPGACAPKDAVAKPPRGTTPLLFGATPDLQAGPLPTAHWTLQSATLVLPPMAKAQIDGEKSLQISRGQAWTQDGQLTVDAAVRLLIGLGSGAGLDTVDAISQAGTLQAGTKPGEATWTPTCGGESPQTIRYGVTGDVLTVQLTKKVAQYNMPAVYTFKRD